MIFHDHKTGVFRWLVFAATLRDDTAKIGAKVVNKIWSYWVISIIYIYIWFYMIWDNNQIFFVAGWICSWPHVGCRISGMMLAVDCGDLFPQFGSSLRCYFFWSTICTSEKIIPMMVFAPAWFGCTFGDRFAKLFPRVRLAASHPPSGTRRLLLFFFGFHAKKRRSKTWCLSTREHVFYLGTFLYLKSSAPVWVQAFSMMQPMFRKLDQQEVHTTGSEREVCVFVAWAQN